ncbi:unnamed protein product, partial [Effrenium voratum]
GHSACSAGADGDSVWWERATAQNGGAGSPGPHGPRASGAALLHLRGGVHPLLRDELQTGVDAAWPLRGAGDVALPRLRAADPGPGEDLGVHLRGGLGAHRALRSDPGVLDRQEALLPAGGSLLCGHFRRHRPLCVRSQFGQGTSRRSPWPFRAVLELHQASGAPRQDAPRGFPSGHSWGSLGRRRCFSLRAARVPQQPTGCTR